jgi:predicted MPP superfamily phosphohydrolase
MSFDLEAVFRALSLATLVGIPLYAWWARGRAYAIFGFFLLAFSLPGAWITHLRLAAALPGDLSIWMDAAFACGMAATAAHLVHLTQARLRSRTFRLLVSVPGQTFLAASFMAGFWQLGLGIVRVVLDVASLDAARSALNWLDPVPYAVAVLSVVTSSRRAMEWVRIPLARERPAPDDDEPGREIARLPVERHRRRAPAPPAHRPLRIVQISDPHLGPWQSVARLRRLLDDLLSHDPDLVLLTGDFLTMEGQGSRGALSEALAPLRGLSKRSFAIFGNHDHESPDEVREALDDNGIALLMDSEAIADTPVGAVQILGADHHRRESRERLTQLLDAHPRRPGLPRLLMLHDPLRFRHVPDGEVDLTLSGHTHGGQVGLVSLGLDWTVLSRTRWPDHGLFARGGNRLYVHRGTGFYGFPLRVGVPGETSMLELVWS